MKYQSGSLIFFNDSRQLTFFIHLWIFSNFLSILTPTMPSIAHHLQNHGYRSMSANVNQGPREYGKINEEFNCPRIFSKFSTCFYFSSFVFDKKPLNPQNAPINGPWACVKNLILRRRRGSEGINSLEAPYFYIKYQEIRSLSTMVWSPSTKIGTFPSELGSCPKAFLQVSVNHGSLFVKETSLI